MTILVVTNHFVPHPLDWSLNFSRLSKDPFGCYVLNDLLNNLFPDKKTEINDKTIYLLPDNDSTTNSIQNFIIITGEFVPDNAELQRIFDFVESGNTFFCSAQYFSNNFSDTLKFKIASPVFDSTFFSKSKQYFNFYNPQLKSDSGYFYQKFMDVNYFSNFDSSKCVVISHDKKNRVNYFKYPFGKGNFFIHANPLIFTNYHLLYSNYQFVFKTLSYLPIQNTIWDEFYKPGTLRNTSPFQYLISQPALKTALYITMAAILLFMVFEGKRKQRQVPVIKPLANSTIEYVKTIGRLYLRQQNHKNVALKKYYHFLEYLHQRYYFPLSTAKDNVFIKKLSQKSGVDEESVNQIFSIFNYIVENQQITDTILIDFASLIDNFYKNAK